MNLTDIKIYISILELLKGGENVTINSLSKISGISRSLIYYRLNNLYLLKQKIKEQKNDRD